MNADNAQMIKDCLIDAALAVASEFRWDDISMIDIAQRAEMDLDDALAVYETKSDVLTGYGRRLDRQITDNIGTFSHAESCRDRLFDIFIERYELLNENRAAVISLFQMIKGDPKQALSALPHLHQSIAYMADLAAVETGGLRGAARLAGLSGVYLHGLYTFIHDDSADLVKVMATVDKDLIRAEKIANLISL